MTHDKVPAGRRWGWRSPGARLALALPLALLVGGCESVPKLEVPKFKLPDIGLPGTKPDSRPSQPPPQARVLQPPLRTRAGNDVERLFEAGTVRGDQLVTELMAIRTLMDRDRSGAALGQLVGRVAPPQGQGGNWWQQLVGVASISEAGTKLAMQALERSMEDAVRAIAYQALIDHLQQMSGDREALRNESVTLPKGALSVHQRQRALTLGALVVGARLTSKMLKQAQLDLASLDTEYQQLIERRQEAAKLLQSALAGGMSRRGQRALSARDVTYLRSLSVAEFSSDMGAQQLALDYMAAVNPKAFRQYQAQSEGLSKRTQATLRVVTGSAAFGAMLAVYGKELSKLADAAWPELVVNGPLALAFATEVPPLLWHGGSVWAKLLPAWGGRDKYRVTVDGKTREVSDADAIFDALDAQGAATEWRRALFRDRGRGLLHAVYRCDPPVAAGMLDAAVPSEARMAFARATQLPDAEHFSFVNAFDGSAGARGRSMPERLLARDHRSRTDDATLAYAELQRRVAEGQPPGYREWDDDQMLRLIFSNRESASARYAMLEVKGVQIRPVPSMLSLQAYEALADACRKEIVGR
jgi:hypothetical protein